MKKILTIIICLVFILSAFTGCKSEETETIRRYEFNTYNDIIDVEWRFFKGSVNICKEEKFVTYGDSCLKIDIDCSYVSGQSAISVAQNQQNMPQFVFQLNSFGDIESNKIGQVCFDVYNACDRKFEMAVLLYDKTSGTVVYSDVKSVYAGRVNNLIYDVPELFFSDYQGKISEIILCVNDAEINDGITLYFDNMRVVERHGANNSVNKKFAQNEILSFDDISDMKYVISKNVPLKYIVYPTITGYVSYYDGGGEYDKASVKLSMLGVDGFTTSTPDSFKKDEQGCGFTVLSALFAELPVSSCKKLSFNVYNDSPSPRVIRVDAEDSFGEKISYEFVAQSRQERTVDIKSISKLNLQRLVKFDVVMDTWNVAQRFDVYFNSFVYEV